MPFFICSCIHLAIANACIWHDWMHTHIAIKCNIGMCNAIKYNIGMCNAIKCNIGIHNANCYIGYCVGFQADVENNMVSRS